MSENIKIKQDLMEESQVLISSNSSIDILDQNLNSYKLQQIENQLTDNLEKYLNQGDYYYQTSIWQPEDSSCSEKNYELSKNEEFLQQDTTHDEVTKSKTLKCTKKITKKRKEEKINKYKRQRENTIEMVVQKVQEWRRYYQVGTLNNGVHVKVNLQDSADLVGVPRKTLDDYLSQIKRGQHTEFDFIKNMKKKIGVLRQHNKKNKLKYKNEDIKNSKCSIFDIDLSMPSNYDTSNSEEIQ